MSFLIQDRAFSRTISTEERFHDLFTTAGYATAFGAALGAAALSFKDRPESHLRYVAVGASLGFIGGSLIGSYVIFSPMVAMTDPGSVISIAEAKQEGLYLRPQLDLNKGTVTGLAAQWTMAHF